MDNISKIISMLSLELQALFVSIENNSLLKINEIRLRKNKPLIVYIGNTPYFITSHGKLINYLCDDCVIIDNENFEYITDSVCNNSYHTKMNTMINGYIPLNNGLRVGTASSAVYKENDIKSVKDITSLNIRIPGSIKDCSRKILSSLYVNETPSIIVAGPPSGGKTTFLRDATKNLSSGFAGSYRKVTVIDERDEIGGNFNLGVNTDVIKNFPKEKAIEIAVRTLSPQIIVCDEIGCEDELNSIKFAFSSGVSFIVTVHARSKEDLLRRSIIRNLISLNEFNYIVLLKNYTDEFEIYDISEGISENDRKYSDNPFFSFNRTDCS